jgi:hypothetical protein
MFFSDVLAAIILEAKRTGKWDMGIMGKLDSALNFFTTFSTFLLNKPKILDLGSSNEIVYKKETKFYTLNTNDQSSRKVEMHTVKHDSIYLVF